MDVTRDNLINAYFTDDVRTLVHVSMSEDNGRSVHSTLLDMNDPTDPQIKRLLSVISIEEIEENTVQQIQVEQNDFKQMIKGMVESGEISIASEPKDQAAQIFQDIEMLFDDTAYSADDLFEFKLACFDREEVINASTEVKEKLRLATTMVGAHAVLINDIILATNNEPSLDQDGTDPE